MKKLITNAARIHLKNNTSNADSILIDDSKIVSIGKKDQFQYEIEQGIEIIDAERSVILPGFIDAHNHFCYMATEAFKINLCGLYTKSEILHKIHENLKSIPVNKPILCCNWEYGFIPAEERISADDLDNNFPGREVQIEERSGHLSITNKYTLDRAGIDWRSSGCRCPNNPAVFSGEICGKVNSALGRYFKCEIFSPENLRLCYKNAAATALSHGVTGIHAICSENDFDNLYNFQSCIPLHLLFYVETKNVEKIHNLGIPQIGGCGAVMVDGDTTPYTAAFFTPYDDHPETKGILYYSDEELLDYVRHAHQYNMQIGLHCVGDAASDQLIRSIETVQKKNPKPIRHRIEHFEFANDDMIRRVKKANICLSVQPTFNHIWPHDTYIENLGEERALQADRIGSPIHAGIHVCFGSDCPVTACAPLLAIQSAVLHSNPAERIDAATAIDCQTFQSAYCGNTEHLYGSIAPGKTADLVFLAEDPLTVPSESIKDIKVRHTMVSGEIVFSR